MTTSEEKNLQLTKSISRMIWLNKKIAFFHKNYLLRHSEIIPRVLLDENCSSKKIISGLKKIGWKAKLVRFAERGLSDETVFSLFDDWRPHLFITFDRHFAQYDRFSSQYQGIIDENGHLDKWLPIIYLLPSRFVKKPHETARHVQERIKRFQFGWEDYSEYQMNIMRYNFGIITIRGERKSHNNDHAPFKENICIDAREIDLSSENLTFISLMKFKECSDLEIINLTENELISLNIDHLAECENLEHFLIDDKVKLNIDQDLLKQKLPLGLEKLKNEGRLN